MSQKQTKHYFKQTLAGQQGRIPLLYYSAQY